MQFERIVIVRQVQGMDIIRLITTLPNPRSSQEGPLVLEFRADRGTGEDFCLRHFPLLPMVVIIQ